MLSSVVIYSLSIKKIIKKTSNERHVVFLMNSGQLKYNNNIAKQIKE